NVFFWSGSVFYAVYERQNRLWGLSALADHGIAGAVMMIEGSIVTLVALAWLFLRMASEGELRQQLLERGLDARTVKRAVRYGRANSLREFASPEGAGRAQPSACVKLTPSPSRTTGIASACTISPSRRTRGGRWTSAPPGSARRASSSRASRRNTPTSRGITRCSSSIPTV